MGGIYVIRDDAGWGGGEEALRLGLVTVCMPLWTPSIDLTVADFFLGTTGDFDELSAVGFFVCVLNLKHIEI